MATPSQTIEKVKALLQLANDSLTKEDFVKAFENVVNLVKEVRAQNEREIAAMQTNIRLLGEKLSTDAKEDLATLKNEFNVLLSAKIAELDSHIINGKDGKDGQKGDKGEPGVQGPAGKNADLTPILAAFSKLQDEIERRIETLDERSKELANQTPRLPAIFGPGKTKVIVLDLSSRLDGVTKSFVIGTHFGIVNVSSSSAPFGAWRPIIDYKEVGKNIVFDPSLDASQYLAAGQSLIIQYLR